MYLNMLKINSDTIHECLSSIVIQKKRYSFFMAMIFPFLCPRLGELSAVRLLDCQTIDMEDWPVISDWMNRVVGAVSEAYLAVKTDYLVVNSLGNNEGHTRTNPFLSRLLVSKNLTVLSEK